MLALGVIARQLERRFDRFRAGIGEENFLAARARRQSRQLLRQLDHRLVVKIAAADMQKLARLLLDRLDHARMSVARVGHGDPGHEVEKQISVDIFDHAAAPLLDDQRIDPAVRRRGEFLVALDDRFGFGAGQRCFDMRVFSLIPRFRVSSLEFRVNGFPDLEIRNTKPETIDYSALSICAFCSLPE